MTNQKTEKLLLGAIIVSMILWGLSWPSGKVLTHYLSPVNFVAWRFILVVVSLFPLILIIKAPLTGNKKGIPHIVVAGILLAIYAFLFNRGLKTGMAGA